MSHKSFDRLRCRETPDRWIPLSAAALLNEFDLVVQGEPYRIAELEFYLHGEDHRDPFAHRNPIQREFGRWYFHKTGGTYRGGTFKGLDLTLGDGQATCGVLIRSIVSQDDVLIDGPCRVVDYLLAKMGIPTVALLDEAIGRRTAWNSDSPVAIAPTEAIRAAAVYATARVGLTLKRLQQKPDALRFIGQPYRFLTEPRRVRKGKPHLVAALHARGMDTTVIREQTGCPRSAIERYLVAVNVSAVGH